MLLAADDELHKLGLAHLEVIGTRFIDEHHEIHDYPGDKEDDHFDHDDSSEDSDYHHAIYDHVDISKDDYSDFGGDGRLSARPDLNPIKLCSVKMWGSSHDFLTLM